MNKDWLLTFADIDSNALNLVGAKALNLSLLSRNGVSTPPGLVVTTTFFEHQINHYAFAPIWAGSPDVAVTEGALQFLADFLKTTPLAPPLEAALSQQLSQLFSTRIRTFAVRSSAIDEDQRDHSFAGCYLTELGVPRQMIPISLTRCWASALSGRSIEYRLKQGLSLQGIKIAVLIQPMLDPDSAGVAFSVNPVTGSRDEIIIEATPNLGLAVVNGTVNPYRYYLTRQPPTFPLAKAVPGDDTSREPLTESKRLNLARQVEQLEALMGAPQDVEWAYQNNRLYILQTRPAMVAASTTPTFFDTEPTFDTQWTRANHPEILPELPSPLFCSLMERTQTRGIQFFEQMGLNVPGIGPYIKCFNGRPYLNLSMIRQILAQLGFNPMPLLAMAGYTQPNGTQMNPFGLNWQTMWHSRKRYLNFFSEIKQMEKRVAAYEKSMRRIANDLKKDPATPTDALSQFKLREQVYGDLIGAGLVLFSALSGLTIFVARLITPLAPSTEIVFATLGTLGKDPATLQHNAVISQLSRQSQEEPEVLNYLTGSDTYSDYKRDLKGTRFLAAFEAYLTEFGYRAMYEEDMSRPRYAEQPEMLLQAISRTIKLANGNAPESAIEGERRSVWHAWHAWHALTGNPTGINRLLPWRKTLALPLMQWLNKAFLLRESMRTAEAQAMAAVRQWDLRLAEKWVRANYLNSVEDYFQLTMEEIERALATNKAAGIHLKPAISARKIAYQTYQDTPAPFVLRNSEIPALSMGQSEAEALLGNTLMGLAVSPGQVQGDICFLQDFEDVSQVPKGKILVAPSTDPVYLPYFPLAAGLIVEIGGMLSHGSIIAREYGLPAVSGITNARKLLNPGDRILLDGSTGVIQILEKAR